HVQEYACHRTRRRSTFLKAHGRIGEWQRTHRRPLSPSFPWTTSRLHRHTHSKTALAHSAHPGPSPKSKTAGPASEYKHWRVCEAWLRRQGGYRMQSCLGVGDLNGRLFIGNL